MSQGASSPSLESVQRSVPAEKGRSIMASYSVMSSDSARQSTSAVPFCSQRRQRSHSIPADGRFSCRK